MTIAIAVSRAINFMYRRYYFQKGIGDSDSDRLSLIAANIAIVSAGDRESPAEPWAEGAGF